MIGALFCGDHVPDARFDADDEDFEMSRIYEDSHTITYSGDSYNTPTKAMKGSSKTLAKGSVKGSESGSRKSRTQIVSSPIKSNINANSYVSVRNESNKRNLIDQAKNKRFALSSELENGAISLAPEESIIASWQTTSSKMHVVDYLWSILTLGLYYIATQWYQYRKRNYTLFVTNQRMIIKEEMFDSVGLLCNTQQFYENQISFHLSSLAYFCTEHVGSHYCGLFPPKVTLELHFIHSPAWSDRPDNAYHPKRGLFTWVRREAYYLAYGVKLFGSAEVRIAQLNTLSSLSTLQHFLRTLLFTFILFPSLCLVGIYLSIARSIVCLTSFSFGTSGQYQGDRRRFLFEAEVFHDLDCVENLGTVIKAMTDQLPALQDQAPGINEITTTKAIKSRDGLDLFGNAIEPLHNSRSRGREELTFYRDLLPLGHSEILIDGFVDQPDNPHNSKSACYYFTSNRLIRQELWLEAKGGGLLYARAESWFLNSNCTQNMLAINFHGSDHRHLLIASGMKYELEVMISSLEGALRLWQVLTLKKEKRRDSISHIPPNEYDEYEEFRQARLTRGLLAFDKSEWVESTILTQPPSCCCVSQTSILTATNAGLYLEKVFSKVGQRKQQRIVFYRAWKTLQSSYWSNYQRFYCNGVCYAPNSGSRLMVTANENEIFSAFGCDIPDVYYATEHSRYNALVDTINLRTYAGGELHGLAGRFILDV